MVRPPPAGVLSEQSAVERVLALVLRRLQATTRAHRCGERLAPEPSAAVRGIGGPRWAPHAPNLGGRRTLGHRWPPLGPSCPEPRVTTAEGVAGSPSPPRCGVA